MISFDYLTLKAFFEENKDFFKGARLQKIQQPTRRDFVLTIRGFETRKLYINIDPQVYHLCFISDETSQRRNITIPQKPPMFCMLLRKYLEGFRISGVNVPLYERIFEIYFESYNELNEKIKLCLAIELMGKYSNVILYNCDTSVIIGCAHNVGSEKSKERELSGTLPYIYPPKQEKSDILKYFGRLNYEELNDNFMGFSKAFQTQLERNNISLDKIKSFLELKSELSPAVNEKEFSVYSELLENPVIYSTVNEMIDEYFSSHQEKIIKRALRLKLRNVIYPQLKKQKELAKQLANQLTKKDNASKYKKYADLIMANLYCIEPQKEISLSDYETGKSVVIPFDTSISIQENAQKYYKMYSKSKNAIERLIGLENEAIRQAEYYEEILCSIELSDNLNDLFEVLSECEELGLIKSVSNSAKKLKNEMKIDTRVINGFKVYIGKNNKQNDYIVSKVSAPEDIWFHTQNCPGSHILLKVTDNKIPEEATIYECCKLAKKYSSAKDSTKIGVIYTKRKYLKKPPKTHLGYVTYKNEQEIIVG